MALPFKEVFCIYARCTPSSYTREILYRCLHPNARPFASVIYWLEPQATFHTLREIGNSTSLEDFNEVLSDFHYLQKLRGGFLAHGLNLRLSTHLLEKLHEKVRRQEANGNLVKL